MKTRRRKSSSNSSKNVVVMFLRMLNTVKLYHWKTTSYAQHKATDELYSDLNSSIDKYVETMLGKKGDRVNLSGARSLPLLDYTSIKDFSKEVSMYKDFMIRMNYDTKNTDLSNIRDEILGHLNQFTYLLTFK
jgi:hypothetical protein